MFKYNIDTIIWLLVMFNSDVTEYTKFQRCASTKAISHNKVSRCTLFL